MAPNWRKPARHKSFFKKQPCLKNEEIYCISNKGTAKIEWENDDNDFLWAWYSVYKKLGQFFFHTSCSTV